MIREYSYVIGEIDFSDIVVDESVQLDLGHNLGKCKNNGKR